MLQLTIHHPQTCRCILAYTSDDSVEAVDRESTFKIRVFFQRGPEMMHLNEPDDEVLYRQIVSEYRSQSYLLALAQTLLPSLTNEDYTWFFDDRRILHATFAGMSDSIKNQLKGNLKYEGEPGVVLWDMAGKVVVE